MTALRMLPAALVASLLLIGTLRAEVLFPPADPEEIRIASYNVENYLPMPRRIGGKLRTDAGKPESERDAVVRMIKETHPDLIGLMEIGGVSQLDDLKRRLSKAGLDYAHTEYLEGADPTRHVVLLSRYPFTERHSLPDVPLRVGGISLRSPRGILDVTVEPRPGYRLRIVCVHLKAKLEVEAYDATSMRNAEAAFLRRHVREILREDPSARLLVMGDFNETKNDPSIREITGKPEWPDSLRALPLTDDRGESWTEYWAAADIYSRIDYVMVSKKLEPEIDTARSAVARFPFWREASDHCPVVVTLRKPNEPNTCAAPNHSP